MKKEKGFVLAFAVVIMSVGLVISSLIIGLGPIRAKSTEQVENRVKCEILTEQVTYDFLNLLESDFNEHLVSLGATKEEDNFTFENLILVKVTDNFNNLKIVEIKTDKVLKNITKNL